MQALKPDLSEGRGGWQLSLACYLAPITQETGTEMV